MNRYVLVSAIVSIACLCGGSALAATNSPSPYAEQGASMQSSSARIWSARIDEWIDKPMRRDGGVYLAQVKKGSEHTSNKSPSTLEKHQNAQASRDNQADVAAWKSYKQNGGKLAKSAWINQGRPRK